MAKKINVKLILELRGNGMGRNAIARTRHISVNSVGDVFHKADEHGISYEDVRDMDEDSVYRMFYPDKFVQESMYARPDYGYVHQELKRVGVTLKLLWQEPGSVQGGWQHSHGIHEILQRIQRLYHCEQADKPSGT